VAQVGRLLIALSPQTPTSAVWHRCGQHPSARLTMEGRPALSALAHVRARPKRATQEPADAVGNPESEHGRKRDTCRDKPKLNF
jgi:hypothetical protein